MNGLLRIPFGWSESAGERVDVNDVPNGLACGCICESCKVPLVARQGPDREWHFAHSPKGAYVKVSKECEYSVYVSIALMAKQLFMSCNSISLPEYAVTLNGRGEVTGERHSIKVTVTKSSVVDIESCKVETDVNGLKADILTSVKGMPLLFYLTHPERRLTLDEAGLHGRSIGVVSIDLTLVPQLLRHASGSKGGYKSELAKFLFDGCSGKQWIYHPRQDGKLLEGNDRLKVLCEERGVKRPRSKAFFSPHMPVIPEELRQPENRQVRYQCVHCNGYEWVGPDRGGDTCPKCQQHFYARRLGVAR